MGRPRKLNRVATPRRPSYVLAGKLVHALLREPMTRPQLVEYTGLSSLMVGNYLRAFHQGNEKCVAIVGWKATTHNLRDGKSFARLMPLFFIGTGPNADIPAHLAHLPRSFALYD